MIKRGRLRNSMRESYRCISASHHAIHTGHAFTYKGITKSVKNIIICCRSKYNVPPLSPLAPTYLLPVPSLSSIFRSACSCATTHRPPLLSDSLSSSMLSNVQNNPTVQKISTNPTHHRSVDRNIKIRASPGGAEEPIPAVIHQIAGGKDGPAVSLTIPGTCSCTMGDDARLVTGVDVAPDGEPTVSAAGLF